MKQQVQFLLASALVAFIFTGQIQAQDLKSPRPVSPAAKVSQTIGLSEITVAYSRPQLDLRGNDRSGKIWGQQVPYGFTQNNIGSQGEIPWRAGANENTIISFSDDVSIEGKALAAGSYGLHMAVYEDGKVTVIFSTNTSSWGSYYYNTEEDALRVDVKMEDHAKTDVLTYDFIEYGSDYTVLALLWDEKAIPVKIGVDVVDLVYKSYEDQLRGSVGFGWVAYITAANFCVQNNMHLEKASEWIDISISRNKNYQNLSVKAAIYELQGDQAAADKTYQESVQLANNAQLNALGYQMLNQGRNDKAIEFFSLNVKRHPNDPNVYDSLGEAYKISGDNKNAIKNLKKALSLDPPANVKANSTQLLKDMGVNVES